MSTKRNGRRKKFTIVNQLYRRFTNRRKGYTPRKIDYKAVVDPYKVGEVDWSRGYCKIFPIFNGINRLYSLPIGNKVHLPEKVFNLDQHSSTNPESLIALASSLSRENIAICTYSEGRDKYIYNFVFRKKSNSSDVGLIHLDQPVEQRDDTNNTYYTQLSEQETEHLLPGLYYTKMHQWGYTREISDTITLLKRDIVNEMTVIDSSNPISSLVRDYAIYIPFDAIETPILQAYLPLRLRIRSEKSKFFTCVQESPLNETPLPLNIRSNVCYWMGEDTYKKTEVASSYDYEGNYCYRADTNFIEVSYLANIAKSYLSVQNNPQYYLMKKSVVDNVKTTSTYNSKYKIQTFNMSQPSASNYQSEGSTLSQRYSATLTDQYLYLCSVKPYVSYGSPYLRGVILGEFSHGTYLVTSYKYFSKEVREILENLSVPINEEVPFSDII